MIIATANKLMFLLMKAYGLGITNMVLGSSEVDCLLLKEKLKSGEHYSKIGLLGPRRGWYPELG